MNKKKNHPHRLKYVFIISFVILIGGLLSVNFILENLVKKEVYSQLSNRPDNLYDLQFDEVKINIFTGTLKVINLSVSPSDSANKMLRKGKIKKLLRSNIPVFKVNRLNILEFLKNKFIHIQEVDVTGFTLDYLVNTNVTEPERKNTFVLHDIFSDNFKGANIEVINLNADIINLYKVDKEDTSFFEIDSVSIAIDNINIDPETLKNPIPIEFSDVRISTGHFSINSMKFYTISTSEIHFDVQESSMEIDGFKLTPKFSKTEFNQEIRYNTDWFSISTEKIKFNGLSVDELVIDDLLEFNSIEIEGPVIEIYRDKRLPDAPFKYKPLLAGMVHKIPLAIHIDTITISKGRLQYEEQTDASDQPGMVFFDPLHISVYNITNHKDRISKNPSLQIDFHGRIMAATDLNAQLDIDLASDHEIFSINGTLNQVSGVAFNPMVEHLMPVVVKSADISKAAFNFTANDDISRGEMTMDYDNLSVEVKKTKDPNKKAGLISAVANGLVRKNNIPGHSRYRTGTIRFERRKDRAIVNFMWNSCKTGIISIVAPIADHTKKAEKQEQKKEKKEMRENKKHTRKN